MRLGKIISKNFKVLFRTKMSLIILLLSPLLVIIMLGILFNNYNLYNINVGYQIVKDNELNAEYIDVLKANFNMIEYNSEHACIEGIEKGLNHVCIIFSGDNNSNKLEIKIDSSKKNIQNIVEKLVLGTLDSQTENFQTNNTENLIKIIGESEASSQKSLEQLGNLSQKIEALKASQKSLDTETRRIKGTFDIEDLDLDDIEKGTDTIKDEINNFLDISYTQIDEMLADFATVSSNINSANFTSGDDEQEVKDSIDSIEDELDNLRTNVYALKKDSNVDSFDEDISDLVNELEEISSILSKSTSQLETLKSNLIATTDVLENNTASLLSSNSNLLESINNIKIRDSQSIINPYEIEIEDALPYAKNHLSHIFPSILVSLIFVISIFFSANFILFEKENNASFRNFLTQTRSSIFFFANFFTLFLIVFVQLMIILVVYYFMFLRNFTSEILMIMLISVPLIMLFVLIGMLIGYISNSQTSNIVLSFMLIFLLLAFSGLMVPLEILSQKLISIISYNPYLLASGIFRKFILFKSTVLEMYMEFIVLFVFIIVFILLGMMFSSITMKGRVFRLYIHAIRKIKGSKIYKSLRKISIKPNFKIFNKDKKIKPKSG